MLQSFVPQAAHTRVPHSATLLRLERVAERSGPIETTSLGPAHGRCTHTRRRHHLILSCTGTPPNLFESLQALMERG